MNISRVKAEMIQDQNEQPHEIEDEDPTQNSGVKSKLIDTNPAESLEQSRNATEGKNHNASGGTAASTAEEHIPSNSDPNATDLPTAR